MICGLGIFENPLLLGFDQQGRVTIIVILKRPEHLLNILSTGVCVESQFVSLDRSGALGRYDVTAGLSENSDCA